MYNTIPDVSDTINYYQRQMENHPTDMNLNDDMLYEILLRAPVENISALCTTNKYTNKLCTSEQFWLKKLSYMGLDGIINLTDINEYLPKDKSIWDWIELIQAFEKYKKKTLKIVNYVLNFADTSMRNLTDDDYYKTSLLLLLQIPYSLLNFVKFQFGTDSRKDLSNRFEALEHDVLSGIADVNAYDDLYYKIIDLIIYTMYTFNINNIDNKKTKRIYAECERVLARDYDILL